MKTLFAAICLAIALPALTWAAEDFSGTKEVRLIHGDLGSPKAKTVVMTDKAKIKNLVGAVKLEKKVPCGCDHIDHAVFVNEKGQITVSLCDHCFDIGKDTYRMPPEFYKLYLAYAQEILHGRAADTIGTKLVFDTYSGYFVSNKFEPSAAESFVVITDQEQFDKVFGVGMTMWDKSHRLPKDAFTSLVVVAAVKRGEAIWEYKVEGVTEAKGVVELRYTTTEKKSDTATFACPLIVSIPKGNYTAVQFVENGKPVKKVGVGKKPEATEEKAGAQRHEVFYSGRVQGVGFRYTTQTLAKGFAVTGFVKNLPDGRVQLVVEGQPKEIESLLAAIRKKMENNIGKTEEKASPATGEFQGFEIRY